MKTYVPFTIIGILCSMPAFGADNKHLDACLELSVRIAGLAREARINGDSMQHNVDEAVKKRSSGDSRGATEEQRFATQNRTAMSENFAALGGALKLYELLNCPVSDRMQRLVFCRYVYLRTEC